MKKLFLYYSFTGNGDQVAEYMQQNGYELRRVVRKKKMPSSFFWGVMIGGFLAGIDHKDKLKDFNADVKDYDEVVVGSPVWNAKFSCPVNTVLDNVDFAGKKVNFVFWSGSGEAPKAIDRIKKEFPEAKAIVLQEPKKYPENLAKLDEFCKE